MTPIYQSMEPKPHFFHMLMMRHMAMQEARGVYQTRFLQMGPRMPIRIARNRTCFDAVILAHADYLFMVDDDTMPKDNTLDLLLEVDADIVGSLCFSSAGLPTCFLLDEDGMEFNHPDPPRNGNFPVAAVGTGAMLIKTEVLKKLEDPWFYFTKEMSSMDVNFCRDARKLGCSIYCSADALIEQLDHGQETTPMWDPQPIGAPPESFVFSSR
jgi:hypothetical protein